MFTRNIFPLAVILVLLFSCPVSANAPLDYIQDELNDWLDIAADKGLNVLESKVGISCVESQTMTYNLTPGHYHLFGSGGLITSDIDFIARGDSDRTVGSDTRSDKIPYCQFILHEPETIEITLNTWFTADVHSTDYYCMVLASEGDGWIVNSESPEPIIEDGSDVPQLIPCDMDEWLSQAEAYRDEWAGFAEDAGGWVVRSNIVSADEAFSFDFNWRPGKLVLFMLPDSRCTDFTTTVSCDMEGVIESNGADPFNPGRTDITVNSNDPFTIEFEPTQFDTGFDETYVAYVIVSLPAEDQ